MVSPEDFLVFAQKCLGDGEGAEIDCRMAAARAYYSVMHLVRAELDVVIEKGKGAHEQVRRKMYSVPPVKTPAYLQQAKNNWSSLYDARVRADYFLESPFDKTDAMLAIGRAKRVFDQLRLERDSSLVEMEAAPFSG